MSVFIHPLAEVQTTRIGDGSRIWQFVVILAGARIGADANVCAHCFIENDVTVGDRVTIKSGVQLWDGVTIGDDVFIGPNVSFTNDKFPRSKKFREKPERTIVESGASLGAGSAILPGLTIGRGAMVGAGAVVTRSVPPNAIVTGTPARIVGYVDAQSRAEPAAVGLASKAGAPRPSKVPGVNLIPLPRITDIRGSLTFGEAGAALPFEVRRYFMIFDVPTVKVRGEHAHRRCHEFLICVKGQVSVVVDDGATREELLLDRPDLGLHLPPMVWSIQYKYSPDAVLVVLASDPYEAEDYIRDYGEFLRLVGAPRAPS